MAKKKKIEEKKKNEKIPVEQKYFPGLGRRKSAVVKVKIIASGDKFRIPESITVNYRPLADYFPLADTRKTTVAPFRAVSFEGNFKVVALAKGGGFRGQAEAMRLAIARALVNYDESNRKILRDLGYLTRDARKVERKKAGLKKARRAPQWQKR